MDFDLSEEQRLLKHTVERLMLDRYRFDERRSMWLKAVDICEGIWARYAELWLLALPFSDKYGGYGGAVETMIVMEAFGKALVLEPYFATVVLAGGVLRRGASEAQKAALIPRLPKAGLSSRSPMPSCSRATISSTWRRGRRRMAMDGC